MWYNSGNTFGGKHIFIEEWYFSCVTTIGDFLNENGAILSEQEFAERFYHPYTPPRQYNSTICAISKYI